MCLVTCSLIFVLYLTQDTHPPIFLPLLESVTSQLWRIAPPAVVRRDALISRSAEPVNVTKRWAESCRRQQGAVQIQLPFIFHLQSA